MASHRLGRFCAHVGVPTLPLSVCLENQRGRQPTSESLRMFQEWGEGRNGVKRWERGRGEGQERGQPPEQEFEEEFGAG